MSILSSDHVGKWYWLRYDDKIILAEEYSSEITRSVSPKNLIQGDAGVHVMGVNGKTMTSTLSSDILIEIPQPNFNLDGPIPTVVTPPFNQGYRDLFDLLISDFSIIRTNLYNPSFWYFAPRNLLSSASIQISDTVRCTLNYNSYYDQLFQLIDFAEVFPTNYDFLARVAKNYDCRFYATDGFDNYLRILSGSVNINVNYTKFYLANTESEYPIYSPQGYEVSGNLTVSARSWNLLRDLFNSKVVTYVNFSILIGDRYLRLGQTVIEDRMNFSMSNNLVTAEISFKGYARL